MTVKNRMIMAFGVVIAFIVSIAIFGSVSINKIHSSTTKLYEHPYKVNLAVSEIRYVLSECQRDISHLANGIDLDVSHAQKGIKAHGEVIEENIAIIKTQFLGDSSYLANFNAKSAVLAKSYERIFSEPSKAKNEFHTVTIKAYENTQKELDKFLTFAKGKGEEFYAGSESKADSSTTIFYVVSIIIIGIAVILANFNIRSILKPLNYAKVVAEEIATGNLQAEFQSSKKDEIGETLSSIQHIVDNIKKASAFTEKIGQGEYDAEFKPVGDHDTLGYSLLDMREKLQAVAVEDERRNWATRGLAVFADILRGNTKDLGVFGQAIISKLIEYMDANQGGIFMLNDSDPNDARMELISAYAYDRQKFLNKEVRLGEGLIGQSWQEREKIYMTNVPDSYVNITSGLGEANPRSVLIMPLKENDEIYGMIELASFNELEEYEIEFLERLTQSIGATFKNLKTNLHTNKLLQESQNMAEMMSQQEEELRQNAEEMQATAEQVHQEAEKHKVEMDGIFKELNSRINILDKMCLVSETDKKGNILKINKKFIEVAKYTEEELVGQPHNIVRHPDMPSEAWKACWATIGKGEAFRAIVKNKAKDGTAYWVDAVIAPKIGPDGKPDGYIGVRYDITEQMMKFETYTMKVGDQEFTIPTK